MASTIRVVGIFTNGARSSITAEERQARFNNDLTLAMQHRELVLLRV